jgi:hypothetical protein
MAIYGDGKHDNGVITTPKRKYTKRKGSGIDKPFQIISVCKADILGIEKLEEGTVNVVPKFNKTDILKLTKADMERIASKLANDYCEQLYWQSLEIIVEYYLEQKK